MTIPLPLDQVLCNFLIASPFFSPSGLLEDCLLTPDHFPDPIIYPGELCGLPSCDNGGEMLSHSSHHCVLTDLGLVITGRLGLDACPVMGFYPGAEAHLGFTVVVHVVVLEPVEGLGPFYIGSDV